MSKKCRCGKEFATERALEQHVESKRGDGAHGATGGRGRKKKPSSFGREGGGGGEGRADGVLDKSSLQDPVNSAGYWLERSSFRGTKSFGAFECSGCLNVWLSAHAFKSYGQGCRTCEVESLPKFLWVNTENSVREKDANPERPHDSGRCEACRRGVCSRAREGGF